MSTFPALKEVKILSGTAESLIHNSPIYAVDELYNDILRKYNSKEFINVQPTQPVCDIDSDFQRTGLTEWYPRIPTISSIITGTLTSFGLDYGDVTTYSTTTPYVPYRYLEYTNMWSYGYFSQYAGTDYYWFPRNTTDMFLQDNLNAAPPNTDAPIAAEISYVSGSRFTTRSVDRNCVINSDVNVLAHPIYNPNFSFDRVSFHGYGTRYYNSLIYYQFNKSPGIMNHSSADLFSYNALRDKFQNNLGPPDFDKVFSNVADFRVGFDYFKKIVTSHVELDSEGIDLSTNPYLELHKTFFNGTKAIDLGYPALSGSINSIKINSSVPISNIPSQFQNFDTLTHNKNFVYIYPMVYHRHTSDGMFNLTRENIGSDTTYPYLRY